MKQLKLTLPWPPSVNHYWGERAVRNRVYKYISTKGVKFRKEVQAKALKAEAANAFNADERLEVTIKLLPPDRRRRDIDNILKSLLDALEHAEVYPDDTQIDILHVYRNINDIEKGGSVIVNIKAIEDEPM